MIRKIKRFLDFEQQRKNPEHRPNESYSQDGEDMVLKAFFDKAKQQTGFFVDVGALHPYRFSNTMHFYKKGWRGINIEPTPSSFALFGEHRKRDINLNIGIGEKNEELTFYIFDEPALNGFSKTLCEERAGNTSYKILDTQKVQVYPLAEVLDKHLPAGTHIDFMSIDVEGLDYEVLLSNNWDKYLPTYMLVEDIIDFNQLNASPVYHFLSGKGYELAAKTVRTLIFKQKGSL